MRYRRITGLAVCLGCGCDDQHACPSICYWLRVDYDAGVGVCSECGELAERWDAGDRSSVGNEGGSPDPKDGSM